MVNYFEETKETFLTIKNRIFQSPKDRIFFQTGRTHAFGQKIPFFSLLDLIKITLQIMLSDFAEKKETFFDLKNTEFFKVQKTPFFKGRFSKSKTSHFFKGLTHAFGLKMSIFS